MGPKGSRNRLVAIHRYVSLALLAIWFLQFLSGLTLVYARTVDDFAIGGVSGEVSALRIDRAIEDLSRTGVRVEQYFISGGIAGNVDVLGIDPSGDRKVWRIDGAGRLLRVSSWSDPLPDVAVARLILIFHKTLLAGEAGRYFVALSAACLLANVGLALKLVWPKRGKWRVVLKPSGEGNRIKRTFEWHRAIGTWMLPAIFMIAATGFCLSFMSTLERWSGSEPKAPSSCQSAPPHGPALSARAVDSAKAVFADASVVSVTLPGTGSSCYKIQMHRSAEQRRAFGTTVVFVEPRFFKAVGSWDALDADLSVKFVVALYTVHTGEWAGHLGRIADMVFAASFLTLIILGFLLWLRRSRVRRASVQSQRKKVAPHP